MEHLWTRRRVENEVALRGPTLNGAATTTMNNNNMMRIFATQEKLFEFLSDEKKRLKGIEKWIPFSIEFVSEYEIEEMREEERRRDIGIAGAGATIANTCISGTSHSSQLTNFFTRVAQEQTTPTSAFAKKTGPLDQLFKQAPSNGSQTHLLGGTGSTQPSIPEALVYSKRTPPVSPRRAGNEPSSPVPEPPAMNEMRSSPSPVPATQDYHPNHAFNKPQRKYSFIVVQESGPTAKDRQAAKEKAHRERMERDMQEGADPGTRSLSPALDEDNAVATTTANGIFVRQGQRQASRQTKFFTAMTREGLERYLEVVPYPQQHLFELILLTNPSRIYLDIERDEDQCAGDKMRMKELLEEDQAGGCNPLSPPVDEHTTTTKTERRDELLYYTSYLRELGATRHATCPFGCDQCLPSRDIDFVVEVLLKYWRKFLIRRRPELNLAHCLPGGFVVSTDNEGELIDTALSRTEQEARKIMREQVTVLQSVPLKKNGHAAASANASTNGAPPKLAKFSIHLIFKFVEDSSLQRNTTIGSDDSLLSISDHLRTRNQPDLREVVLNSNASAGDLVQSFVSFLYDTLTGMQRRIVAEKVRRLGGHVPEYIMKGGLERFDSEDVDSDHDEEDQHSTAEAFGQRKLRNLYRRYQELHTALFYHGDVNEQMALKKKPFLSNGVVEDTITGLSHDSPIEGGISLLPQTAPRLHLKCIIDTAVYSKNRMMRCMGSSKLGKDAVLLPYRSPRTDLWTDQRHVLPVKLQDPATIVSELFPWWLSPVFLQTVEESADSDKSNSPSQSAVLSFLVAANKSSMSSFDVQQQSPALPRVGDCLPSHLGAAFFGTMVSLHHASDKESVKRIADIEASIAEKNNTNRPSYHGQSVAKSTFTVGDSVGAKSYQQTLHAAFRNQRVQHETAHRSTFMTAEESLWSGGGVSFGLSIEGSAVALGHVNDIGGFGSEDLTFDGDDFGMGQSRFQGLSHSKSGNPVGRSSTLYGGGGVINDRTLLCDLYPKGRIVMIVPDKVSLAEWGKKTRLPLAFLNNTATQNQPQRATSVSSFQRDSIQVQRRGNTTLQALNDFIFGLSKGPVPSSSSPSELAAGLQGGGYSRRTNFGISPANGAGKSATIYKHTLYFRENNALLREIETLQPMAMLPGRHLSAILVIVTGFRYCRCVKRAHKSNDVYYTLFLDWTAEAAEIPIGLGEARPFATIARLSSLGDATASEKKQDSAQATVVDCWRYPVGKVSPLKPKRTLLNFGPKPTSLPDKAPENATLEKSVEPPRVAPCTKSETPTFQANVSRQLVVGDDKKRLQDHEAALAKFEALEKLQPRKETNVLSMMKAVAKSSSGLQGPSSNGRAFLSSDDDLGETSFSCTTAMVRPFPAHLLNARQEKVLSLSSPSTASDDPFSDSPQRKDNEGRKTCSSPMMFEVSDSESSSSSSTSSSSSSSTSSSSARCESTINKSKPVPPLPPIRIKSVQKPPNPKVATDNTAQSPPKSTRARDDNEDATFDRTPIPNADTATNPPMSSQDTIGTPSAAATLVCSPHPQAKKDMLSPADQRDKNIPYQQLHFSPASGATGIAGLSTAKAYDREIKLRLLGVRCYQKCFDPECNQTQGAQRSYRSEILPVPHELLAYLEYWAKQNEPSN